ncbi:MAG: 16S rRNA (guanine(527)-N(7))-methyltransferase RsmG [Gammaproteobacteria bacterium]|nr:16S rRNA (guanine(527)-N(7))-methyltransferase RsmG [Gammaproteobacteria bacterium]
MPKANAAALEAVRKEPAPAALPDGATAKLAAFEALVQRWNARSNLVARGDIPHLRERHTADSLALSPWVTGRLADVGAGAGLPGIPLAIARPNVPVVLIERSTRKCAFLRHAVIELDLANVDVVARDVRHYTAPGAFDIITIRAVAPPLKAWNLVRHLLKPGGSVLLQSRERLGSPIFDGGEIVDEAAVGRGWVTAVRLACRA